MKSSGYRTLWLIVGLLLLPFAIAGGLYASGWRPPLQVRGELLPAAPPQLDAAAFEGRWGLALVSGGACGDDCVEQLGALRRVHVALYKAMPSVRRAWLADGAELAAKAESLHARWPDLALVVADATTRQALTTPPGARPARHDLASPAAAADAVIVFDPDGRPVLRYLPPFDPKAVLSDLRRLLTPMR